MLTSNLTQLQCPACRGVLAAEILKRDQSRILDGNFSCVCGKFFPLHNGIGNFLHPHPLLPSDSEFKEKYDLAASNYDSDIDWLFELFDEDETIVRNKMTDLLALTPDSNVLDIGCGTGSDALRIASQIGPTGKLCLLDMSASMLISAVTKLSATQTPADFMLGNAAYLPFCDDTFDAVYHFGGLNNFSEIKKSISEMARVTKPNGKVVLGDEGVAPWLRRKKFGKILCAANPLYVSRPPLSQLPAIADDVCVRWILGNAFYLIDFRVGKSAPSLNLDLPIPRKGDTLRARYEKAYRRDQ